jgi:hypothetical protein
MSLPKNLPISNIPTFTFIHNINEKSFQQAEAAALLTRQQASAQEHLSHRQNLTGVTLHNPLVIPRPSLGSGGIAAAR